MPVFGADPEAEDKGWEDVRTSQGVFVSKPVRELTNYFAYHRNTRMSQRCNDEDKSRLNIFFSRKLKQGFDSASIKEIIDRFYQSPAGQHPFASALFCKDEVQRELMEDIDISNNDPVLQWLLDGMPNTGPFSQPREVRSALIKECDDSLLRYPEVVADIIRIDDPEPHLSERLSSLERLIAWNLTEDEDGAGQWLDVLAIVTLPKELASRSRSPKSIRSKQDSVKDAIMRIPMRRSKES
jgi:hypothetical protein